MASPESSRRVVVVDGCRTPFLRSGTGFRELTAYDLGRMAIAGLLHRTACDPSLLELAVMGTVVDADGERAHGAEVLALEGEENTPGEELGGALVDS